MGAQQSAGGANTGAQPAVPAATPSGSNWNVPNALTVARIVLTPFVCGALVGGHYTAAAGLFVTAGALDALDGWAARALGQTSVLGSFLDPLADKVLISASFVTCGALGLLPLWAVLPGLARDALLIGSGLYLRAVTKPPGVGFFEFGHATSVTMEPTGVSKANTALQLGAVAAAISTAACGLPGTPVVLGLSAAMTATTLASTVQYYREWGSIEELRAKMVAQAATREQRKEEAAPPQGPAA